MLTDPYRRHNVRCRIFITPNPKYASPLTIPTSTPEVTPRSRHPSPFSVATPLRFLPLPLVPVIGSPGSHGSATAGWRRSTIATTSGAIRSAVLRWSQLTSRRSFCRQAVSTPSCAWSLTSRAAFIPSDSRLRQYRVKLLQQHNRNIIWTARSERLDQQRPDSSLRDIMLTKDCLRT